MILRQPKMAILKRKVLLSCRYRQRKSCLDQKTVRIIFGTMLLMPKVLKDKWFINVALCLKKIFRQMLTFEWFFFPKPFTPFHFKSRGESDLVWHEISSIFSRGMRELPILKVIFKNLVYPFVSPEKNWSIF